MRAVSTRSYNVTIVTLVTYLVTWTDALDWSNGPVLGPNLVDKSAGRWDNYLNDADNLLDSCQQAFWTADEKSSG